MSIRTHYENLQVAENASPEVIRGAYRSLSQKWHPDKNPDDRKNAERRMKVINEAYAVLSDPAKRREHDEWIMQMEAEPEDHRPDRNPAVKATSVGYDFVVYPSRKKIAWMFLGSIIFVAIGIGLFLENKSESSWLKEAMRVIAIYLGVPFFGFYAVYYFIRLINPSPSIVINEHGVQVMTFGGATLRWSEIADIRIEVYQKNRFLAIFPTNPEIVMKRQSLWGRAGTKFNASFMGRPTAIVIAEALVGIPLEQLIGEMRSGRRINQRVPRRNG